MSNWIRRYKSNVWTVTPETTGGFSNLNYNRPQEERFPELRSECNPKGTKYVQRILELMHGEANGDTHKEALKVQASARREDQQRLAEEVKCLRKN